ncbi:DNA polymerase III subunit epsilon [Halomonadaceae bacterium LMG 33818]|uniref:DNA polymerase III subunit epsilon n=1 Tax=Cernens ardua TaxID=3402176 RepID=UPI003EDC2BAA
MSDTHAERQIILDTETTGLETSEGHRLIEIGGVEVINRRLTGRHYHQYINPERPIDPEAIEIHGITDERVANEPVFAQVADQFWDFIKGAELVIHNASFDVGFLDYEFDKLNALRKEPHLGPIASVCSVLDTLALAREMHPGQRNNLDALCKRYGIDNTARTLHGALLDAEILAEVYLAMTGGQTSLSLESAETQYSSEEEGTGASLGKISAETHQLVVVQPTDEELTAHQNKLNLLREKAGGHCLWDQLHEH